MGLRWWKRIKLGGRGYNLGGSSIVETWICRPQSDGFDLGGAGKSRAGPLGLDGNLLTLFIYKEKISSVRRTGVECKTNADTKLSAMFSAPTYAHCGISRFSSNAFKIIPRRRVNRAVCSCNFIPSNDGGNSTTGKNGIHLKHISRLKGRQIRNVPYHTPISPTSSSVDTSRIGRCLQAHPR